MGGGAEVPKSAFSYTQVDGKSVKHGIAKRYLEGKLIEEIEYRDGKKVE
jgi:antitoxin component YwqK of YwqJK toxin-antitoxin module